MRAAGTSQRSLAVATLAALATAGSVVGTGIPRGGAAAAAPAGSFWVSNQLSNSLTEYARAASGAATPLATVQGADTRLDQPSGVAVDSSGDLWVSNQGGAGSIAEFPPDASGDQSPRRVISGPATGLASPYGLSVGPRNGVWVTNAGGTPSVTRYAPDATGNAAPTVTISGPSTRLSAPFNTTVTRDGGTVWVSDRSSGLLAFSTHSSGDAAPIAQISGPATRLRDPDGLAVDGAGRLWVADQSDDALTVYAAGATGDVAPLRRIAGRRTGLASPATPWIDAAGEVVVPNADADSIVAFAPGAHGDATPARVLGGAGTGLQRPVAVTGRSSPPSAPRSLRASPGQRRSVLRWQPPVSDGGGLTGYVVGRSRHRSGPWQERQVGAVTTSSEAGRVGHRYFFRVRAVNDAGSSGESATVSAVPGLRPAAPRDVRLRRGNRALSVSWRSPPPRGRYPVTGYVVAYARCRLSSARCAVHQVALPARARHVRLHGLRNGHRYRVTVSGRNRIGAGRASRVATATPQ